MRFYLQNVPNLNCETFQILLIIFSAACPLSEIEAMTSLSLHPSSSAESSGNISTADLLLPTLNSGLDIESRTLKSHTNQIHIMKNPGENLFSDIPNNTSLATNDSNEIDSEDYVMTRHIASHDDDDDVDSDNDDDDDVDSDNDDEDDGGDGSLMLYTTAVMPVETEKEMEIDVEIQLGMEMVTSTVEETAMPIELSHMHGPTNSHSSERSNLTRGRLNKTHDLSSLSLLSIDDDNTNINDEGTTDKENDATATTIQKRIVEQRHQQQQKRISENNGSNNLSNPSNKRITATGNPNGTISNFHHIGSKRIATKSPSEGAAGGAAGTTTAIAQSPGLSRSNNGSLKTSSSTAASMSGRKVESKYILPKAQKTDAPMLNYIFDTFSSANKHHHHDQRYGPHFEDVQRVGQPMNMTVQAGSSIHLNCRISLLQDKTVSWVRRNTLGENALDLLTVGPNTYTGDKRYKLEFQYPNNWRLKITNVKKDDEATYECQISTHPPRVIQTNLLVNAPKVMIVDEIGDPLQEKYYEIDSTLQLSCIVRNIAMATSVVYWKHGEDTLNYDVTRGGVSVKTELMDDGANSTLSIAKINKADSGNYTCSISDFQNFTIVVHILNGESFAELHHGGAGSMMQRHNQHTLALNLTLLILLLCLSATCITR